MGIPRPRSAAGCRQPLASTALAPAALGVDAVPELSAELLAVSKGAELSPLGCQALQEHQLWLFPFPGAECSQGLSEPLHSGSGCQAAGMRLRGGSQRFLCFSYSFWSSLAAPGWSLHAGCRCECGFEHCHRVGCHPRPELITGIISVCHPALGTGWEQLVVTLWLEGKESWATDWPNPAPHWDFHCGKLGLDPTSQVGIAEALQQTRPQHPTHLEKAPMGNSMQGLGMLGDAARSAGFKGRSRMKAACTHMCSYR